MMFYAHTDDSQSTPGDKWQLLEEHLRRVAGFARARAEAVSGNGAELATAAWWTGLLHDVGVS
jgi:HD superfamily phosphohydrolase YqeK